MKDISSFHSNETRFKDFYSALGVVLIRLNPDLTVFSTGGAFGSFFACSDPVDLCDIFDDTEFVSFVESVRKDNSRPDVRVVERYHESPSGPVLIRWSVECVRIDGRISSIVLAGLPVTSSPEGQCQALNERLAFKNAAELISSYLIDTMSSDVSSAFSYALNTISEICPQVVCGLVEFGMENEIGIRSGSGDYICTGLDVAALRKRLSCDANPFFYKSGGACVDSLPADIRSSTRIDERMDVIAPMRYGDSLLGMLVFTCHTSRLDGFFLEFIKKVVFSLSSFIFRLRIEKSLYVNEEKFLAFMKYLPSPAFIFTNELDVIEKNVRARTCFGPISNLSQLSGFNRKKDIEIFVSASMRVGANNEKYLIFRSELVLSSGCRSEFEIHIYPIYRIDNEATFGCFMFDLSRNVEGLHALISSERKYRDIFENAMTGIAIYDLERRTLLELNPTAAKLLDYSSLDEALEKYSSDARISGFFSEVTGWGNSSRKKYCLEDLEGNDREYLVSVKKDEIIGCAIIFITDVTALSVLEEQVDNVRKAFADVHSFKGIIGKSRYMKQLFELMPIVAEKDCNVLIEGASGTGKSLIAKVIHESSQRAGGPFVTVNCGAIPDTLIESELFGYMKGAFTDAKKDKPGRFALATGGTIFLDEIGELPLQMQVKLLRVIEERAYEPLGAVSTRDVDARIIAATNKDLQEEIRAGRFREDLYYRLKVVCFRIPPLRQRRDDIEILIEHFMSSISKKYSKDIFTIATAARESLIKYDYPGNVRELYNILERAFILCNGNIISSRHIIFGNTEDDPENSDARPEAPLLMGSDDSLVYAPETKQETKFFRNNKYSKAIIEAIKGNGYITIAEMAELTGLSVEGVKYHIKTLKSDGVLERRGAKKNGIWIISSPVG